MSVYNNKDLKKNCRRGLMAVNSECYVSAKWKVWEFYNHSFRWKNFFRNARCHHQFRHIKNLEVRDFVINMAVINFYSLNSQTDIEKDFLDNVLTRYCMLVSSGSGFIYQQRMLQSLQLCNFEFLLWYLLLTNINRRSLSKHLFDQRAIN